VTKKKKKKERKRKKEGACRSLRACGDRESSVTWKIWWQGAQGKCFKFNGVNFVFWNLLSNNGLCYIPCSLANCLENLKHQAKYAHE